METITSTEVDQEVNPMQLVSTGFRESVLARPGNRDFSLRVFVSEHAQDRWCQRVHPNYSRREALVELVGLLVSGGFRVRDNAPPWKAPNGDESAFYLMVGSEIALPVGYRRDEPNAVEAKTCLKKKEAPRGHRGSNRCSQRRRR